MEDIPSPRAGRQVGRRQIDALLLGRVKQALLIAPADKPPLILEGAADLGPMATESVCKLRLRQAELGEHSLPRRLIVPHNPPIT